MKRPTEYLDAMRREFPNSDLHHTLAVGMGRDRKREMAEHYSVFPCTREEHQLIHAGDPSAEIKALRWVVRRLCREMEREAENYGEVEGWPI